MAEIRRPERPLERGADRIFGGVCSGLAARLQVDPLLVRLAFIGLAFVNGAGVVLYLLLWLLLPDSAEARARRLT